MITYARLLYNMNLTYTIPPSTSHWGIDSGIRMFLFGYGLVAQTVRIKCETCCDAHVLYSSCRASRPRQQLELEEASRDALTYLRIAYPGATIVTSPMKVAKDIDSVVASQA